MDPEYKKLSVNQQCKILGLSKSTYYYKSISTKDESDIDDLKLIMEVLRVRPFYGYRKIAIELNTKSSKLTRTRIRRIMRRFGLRAIFPGRNLSKARHNITPKALIKSPDLAGEFVRVQRAPDLLEGIYNLILDYKAAIQEPGLNSVTLAGYRYKLQGLKDLVEKCKRDLPEKSYKAVIKAIDKTMARKKLSNAVGSIQLEVLGK